MPRSGRRGSDKWRTRGLSLKVAGRWRSFSLACPHFYSPSLPPLVPFAPLRAESSASEDGVLRPAQETSLINGDALEERPALI